MISRLDCFHTAPPATSTPLRMAAVCRGVTEASQRWIAGGRTSSSTSRCSTRRRVSASASWQCGSSCMAGRPADACCARSGVRMPASANDSCTGSFFSTTCTQSCTPGHRCLVVLENAVPCTPAESALADACPPQRRQTHRVQCLRYFLAHSFACNANLHERFWVTVRDAMTFKVHASAHGNNTLHPGVFSARSNKSVLQHALRTFRRWPAMTKSTTAATGPLWRSLRTKGR